MKTLVHTVRSRNMLVLADQLIFSGASFALTFGLARLLSVSDFGIYSSTILSIYLLISLANALIIQPFQVADKAIRQLTSYSGFLFYLQMAFLVIILLILGALQASILQWKLQFMPLAILISGIILHDYFRKFYLAKGQLVEALIIDVWVAFSQMALIFLSFALNNSDLNDLFLGLGMCYMPAGVWCIFQLKPTFQESVGWNLFFRYHRKEGLWLGLVSLVQWGSANLFIVPLGLFVSIESLGAFRLVQSLFGVLNILFQTFENYVLPNASRLYSDSVSESKAYIRKISLQSSLLIGLVLLVLFLFSRELMMLVADSRYAEYSYIIRGMCLLYFTLFIGYPVRLSIRMLLLNKSFFKGYILSFVFSLLFFHILVKTWQLNGVITGLIINQLIMLLFWNYELHLKKFYLWK